MGTRDRSNRTPLRSPLEEVHVPNDVKTPPGTWEEAQVTFLFPLVDVKFSRVDPFR